MWVKELRRPELATRLLVVFTILWVALHGFTLYDNSEGVYRMDTPRTTLIFGMIIGFPLYGAWMIVALKRRSILLACAATGVLLAFCFFIVANMENIGYTVETFYSPDGGGKYGSLNPLLHLGGGSYRGHFPESFVFVSSMSIKNQLLYLAYGELILFAIAGIGLLARKLASFVTFTAYSRCLH